MLCMIMEGTRTEWWNRFERKLEDDWIRRLFMSFEAMLWTVNRNALTYVWIHRAEDYQHVSEHVCENLFWSQSLQLCFYLSYSMNAWIQTEPIGLLLSGDWQYTVFSECFYQQEWFLKYKNSVSGNWKDVNYSEVGWSDVVTGSATESVSGTQYFRKVFNGVEGMAAVEIQLKYQYGIVCYTSFFGSESRRIVLLFFHYQVRSVFVYWAHN